MLENELQMDWKRISVVAVLFSLFVVEKNGNLMVVNFSGNDVLCGK